MPDQESPRVNNLKFDGATAIQANKALIKNQQQKSRGHRIAKSYNFDAGTSHRLGQQRQNTTVDEPRASNGNIIALACGPLKKPRYINSKIEQELVDFKKEIEEKFQKSPLL